MNFAPGAWKYAIVPLLAAPFAVIYSVAAGLLSLALGVGALAFFRDPERTPPPTGVVSPADGTVSVLREEGDQVRLGVFMNVWHVHVVRAPFDATVVDVEHVSGAHRPAFSKESEKNERVHVSLETDSLTSQSAETALEADGDTDDELDGSNEDRFDGPNDDGAIEPAEVTFIAGAFARRIFPYVEPGDELERGDRIGHIAFGSRVDLCFPPSVDRDEVAVEPGESTTAGETVVLETPADVGPFDTPIGGFDFDTQSDGSGADETDDPASSPS
ncbi:protein sorting system archaetidylserine decarboxylase [Natrarchaeobaculum sulfurireducens]|uniref:Phosphatidylserine decarboxylase n=1 Tax=Natrarchaeobaculum sulfurireducens TaxID=2044521 RepID=A0A346PSN4_9EURY|nr:protein sorting system archaetidylserine decarboxylase [Natrarchaeobaculum sulfurireducens]AXR82529.1 Phosphatidylserine decarboxylase [Natrarchaeobaculum sulfurireducens]